MLKGVGAPAIDELSQHLRFALRQLRGNPGFALTASCVLALGVAASSVIFAFVDATLVRPLPYREPSMLVALYESIPVGDRYHLSYGDYVDWKRLNHVFTSLDVYRSELLTIDAPSSPEQVQGARVSDGFFRTLGVVPMLGRDFLPGEDLPDAHQTVLLSFRSWKNRFAGDRAIVGRSVTLDGISRQVIGVLPRGFHFAPVEEAEFWVTLHSDCGDPLGRECHAYYGVARLKDGVSVGTALADVRNIAQQIARDYPVSNRDRGATVLPLTDVILGKVRPIVLTLWSGGDLLLLIGLVNVSSLLLARAERRRREIAVRGALGASRMRLVRQFAAEGFLLAASGCGLGLALGAGTINILKRQIPPGLLRTMPWFEELQFGAHVMWFVVLASIAAAALFSAIPTIQLFSREMHKNLIEGGRGAVGRSWRRLGARLVIVELTTAMVLLMSAGLLGKSFANLMHVDLGIDPDHLSFLHVQMPIDRTADQRISLERAVRSRMAALPGVVSVGTSYRLSVGTGDYFAHFRVAGRNYVGEGDEENYLSASAGYFETVRAHLNQGRLMTEADDATKPLVAVINQTMANQLFPGESPIGKHLICQYSKDRPMEIIGVIKDIKEEALDQNTRGAVYTAFNQMPDSEFYVTLRTSRSEEAILHSMSSVVRQLDSNVIADGADTMSARIDNTPSAYFHRSAAGVVTGFAVLALLLSAIGLYGVVSYSVSQRTREMGVRIALGAGQGAIYRLILKESFRVVAIGISGGIACSIWVTKLLQSLLFGVSRWDVATLVTVIFVLGGTALIASLIPARSAALTDPAEALRSE